MKLNFVKLHRKLNYFKNLIQYICIGSFVKLINIKKSAVTRYAAQNADREMKEIVFLGNVSEESFLNEETFFKQLNVAIGGADIVFYYSETEGMNPAPAFDIYNAAQSEYAIIDSGNVKIGCVVFDLNSGHSIRKWKLDILRKRDVLIKNGADFCIAYVKASSKRRKDSGRIKRLIGTWGFDYVIGLEKNIFGKRNLRSITFGETRILYSLGRIKRFGSLSKIKHDALLSMPRLAYKTSIQKNVKKVIVTQEGYIPLSIYQRNGKLESVKEIRKYLWEDEEEEKQYLYLERMMRGFRNWRELITLQDIFNVLGEQMPEKYMHLSSCSVNQICDRTYELSPGNVFFFRRAFHDKNDKKREKEFFRNKLIVRALTRKSLFTFSYKKLFPFIPHIVIDDPTEAHIKIMSWYRKKFIHAQYIGITGSVDKTSTKDMLFHVLKQKYKVGRSVRNHNVQVTIGISEQRLQSNLDVFVQEIGGGRPGGASRHSRMILPDIAVVTNIGTAHIGNFESQSDLMNHKLGIIDGMTQDGRLFLNGDDPLLVHADLAYRVTYFAVDNHNADYYADNIKEIDGKTYFDIIYNGNVCSAKINVLGKHNVLNAVCSFAIAKYLEIEEMTILEGLEKFKTTGVRQNLIRVGGFEILADCYNASVDSINNSLSMLTKLKSNSNKKIAIIGDVTGMGEQQQDINGKIAKVICSHDIDDVVVYGNNAEDICSLLREKNVHVVGIHDKRVLERWISENVNREDVLLVKGSSKMRLDESLDTVFGVNLADQRHVDEAQYSLFRRNKASYRVFENYISFHKYYGENSRLVVPNTIFKKNVKKITAKACFNNQKLKSITVGKNVVHIGRFAFAGCCNIENIEFKGNIKFVGRSAFQNCTKLKRLAFSEGLLHIAPNAFAHCKNLAEIRIPKSIGYISESAFRDCNSRIIYF